MPCLNNKSFLLPIRYRNLALPSPPGAIIHPPFLVIHILTTTKRSYSSSGCILPPPLPTPYAFLQPSAWASVTITFTVLRARADN